MSDIEEIRRKIEKIYRAFKEPKMDVPLPERALEWTRFAKTYIGAASILAREPHLLYILPVLQLTGQAVESALKACLAAANREPPNEHDLIHLYKLAAERGFQLDDFALAMIVHLNHYYFRDLATNTKFKSRFPTKQDERMGGALPRHSTCVSIVHSLIEQAAHRIPSPYREKFNVPEKKGVGKANE